MTRALLAGATGLWLAACSAHFSERPRSLDDPSNPDAPEAAERLLPSTLPSPSEAPKPQPEPARGMPHAHPVYTCPMHPEVSAEQPGRCPKCGMNLVPRAPAKEGAP